MNKKLIISVAERVGDPADLFFDVDSAENGVGKVIYIDYEWDRAKSNECVLRNGFSFYYAVQVFVDKYVTFLADINSPSHENRVLAIGHPYGISNTNLLVVVHLDKLVSGTYRIISAFEAEDFSRYEKAYERNVTNRKRASQALKRRMKIDGIHLRRKD